MLLAVTIAEHYSRIPGSQVQDMICRFPHTLLYLRAVSGVASAQCTVSLCTGTVLGGHPLPHRHVSRGSTITQETKQVFEGVSRLGVTETERLMGEWHHSTALRSGVNIKYNESSTSIPSLLPDAQLATVVSLPKI